jgi:hypothetical protein
MGSLPKKVFIGCVQEDGAVAYEIAAGLEAQGYSSWYCERDCPAGADYFEETHKAISDCEAMVIVISPRSLPSDQITREIVRAVESSKATFPLLLEVRHDDYAHSCGKSRDRGSLAGRGLRCQGNSSARDWPLGDGITSEANDRVPSDGFEQPAIAQQRGRNCREADDWNSGDRDDEAATTVDDHWDRGCSSRVALAEVNFLVLSAAIKTR